MFFLNLTGISLITVETELEEKLSNYHINIIVVGANVSASSSLALHPNVLFLWIVGLIGHLLGLLLSNIHDAYTLESQIFVG